LSKATTVMSNGNLPSVDEVQTLRRALARRNEKIEFLKDHVDQLVEELNRKSKLVFHGVVFYIYYTILIFIYFITEGEVK